MARGLGAALAAMLAVGAAGPAPAQDDPFPRDERGSRMERECRDTARAEICLAYFELYCSTWGFPMACAMADLGHACQAGDQGRCVYFQQVLDANSACAIGDQGACNWIAQQTGGG